MKVATPRTFGWAFCPQCGKLQRIIALKGGDGTSGMTSTHDDPTGRRCSTSVMYWEGCQKPWWPTKEAALASKKAPVAT